MVRSQPATLDRIRTFATQGYLYALLDACDEPAVPKRCHEMTEARAVSLYRGKPAIEFAHVAPYLAQLSPADIDWIQQTLWNQPWGYFVIARSDLASLRTNFRHFLKVRLPDNSEVLFRFYDPRVVQTYLKSGDSQTVERFFGYISALGISSHDDLKSVSLLMP